MKIEMTPRDQDTVLGRGRLQQGLFVGAAAAQTLARGCLAIAETQK